ncbi:MAG: META domain-containing protein [Maricaulaceae bacterium]|jgi:heat shock protein HslJ
MRALTLLAALALASCGARFAPPPPVACQGVAPEEILGQWTLERVNGEAWTDTEITMAAEEAALWGQLACNGYGTSPGEDGGDHYAVEDGRLVLHGDIVRTMRLCDDPERMDLEEQMVELLYGSPRISRLGDRLCLFTEEGMILEFRASETAAAN